jgi:type II secretory pathway pseudopilin PulG
MEGKGFALIATLIVLALLTMVAVAFLSLATVQVKNSRIGRHHAEAEANARLALMIAIGELQREMGPDQRVSASAALRATDQINEPYWTTVYRTTQNNGEPYLERDDFNGGLHDLRAGDEGWRKPLNYLVSGNEGGSRVRLGRNQDPIAFDRSSGIRMVGRGSTGGEADEEVYVPRMGVFENGSRSGGYGFWVGDLGVKANVAVLNPHSKSERPDHFLPFLGGSVPESAGIELGGDRAGLDEETKDRIHTRLSFDLAHESGMSWRKANFHHVTVESHGVLANVREGGLQKNLTVFLNSGEDISPLRKGGNILSEGLSGEDHLVGPLNQEAAARQGLDWEETRHTTTAPRFALLRDWVRLGDEVTLKGNEIEARLPKVESDFKIPAILNESSQNLNPVSLTEVDHASLAPILVEGSMFNTFSTHFNPPGSRFPYNIRSHDFPRVVLWNPYSVPISLPSTVAMLQINGRRGFMTDAWEPSENGGERFLGYANWLSFGGRTQPDGQVIGSDAYEDAYTGSYYFQLEETVFQPGECLVFLPDKAAEYDGENVLNNTLSPDSDYDFAYNYYHSASEFDEENPGEVGGMAWYPKKFWYTPSDRHFERLGLGRQTTQGDDSQMILKEAKDQSGVSPEDFDLLPQIAAASCSLQFGAGREPPEAWYHDVSDPNSGVDIEFLNIVNPIVTIPPDRRTRQGYRMRWFREHLSNTQVGGNGLAAYPEAWEESHLANWNLRGAYAARSPFENIIGNKGDGRASGPWFFGIYTKDLYDEAVGWADQIPVRSLENRNLGNPFGPPTEGAKKYVLFDVPRAELGIISLAQFQHAKISEFVWHPSYAIGNSLVDPRLGIEGRAGTAPLLEGEARRVNGFISGAIGWSSNAERGGSEDSWADHGKAFIHDLPGTDNVVYDLSFEVNHSLWDRYFLSSGTDRELHEAAADGAPVRLPNPRMAPVPGADHRNINDFHRAGLALMNEGAFNVNSTSVEAWKAVLSSNRRSDGSTPFPRIIGDEQDEWSAADGLTTDLAWNGTRILEDAEIHRLAEAIVVEVKKRGPFLSLADFVNRRLENGPDADQGTLSAAIERAGLNRPFEYHELYQLNNERSLGDYDHPDNIEDSTRLEQTLKPQSKAWGAPTHLTQADLLQAIGPGLSARSDTFVIRAYGESVDGEEIKARAWCEAILQRLPEPLRPDESGLNPDKKSEFPDFGRRFKVKSFRWLNADEV